MLMPKTMMPAKSGENRWLPFYIHASDTCKTVDRLIDEYVSDQITEIFPLSKEEFRDYCRFCALVHDIGKCTPAFVKKITSHNPAILNNIDHILANSLDRANSDRTTHVIAGAAILHDFKCPDSLVSIIGAHHGKPITLDTESSLNVLMKKNVSDYYGSRDALKIWDKTRREWFDFALCACRYQKVENIPEEINLQCQALIAGLIIMADWLASNEEYFPLISTTSDGSLIDLNQRAEKAWSHFINFRKWTPKPCEHNETWFKNLFGFPPNEMQSEIINTISSFTKAGLCIIESGMGSGKTEAALAGAEIFASNINSSGIVFALPTQSTANGIFPRVKEWSQHQTSGKPLAIRLLHGMAALNESYTSMFKGYASGTNIDGEGDIVIHPWFNGNKQALLSNFVICTIDQILVACTRQKFFMLRHLGLAGKVVIIDECHAYDAFTNEYLHRTLNWLGAYKVPVILLSATLPPSARAELIEAYTGKASDQNAAWRTNIGYPCLTWTQNSDVFQKSIQLKSEKPKMIQIKHLGKEKFVDWVFDQINNGHGCIGIITNTVKEAQRIHETLSTKAKRLELIHAKYTINDRYNKESIALKLVGKDSTEEDRDKLIIIGTQVLEQSLNIDFDCLITELCPTDKLLQRIGRLFRFNTMKRPNNFKEPVCYILTDDGEPVTIASQYIYPEYLLRRTVEVLPKEITLPEDIPSLVRDTYEKPSSLSNQMEILWDQYMTEVSHKKQKTAAYKLQMPDKPGSYINTLNGIIDDDLLKSDAQAEAKVRDIGNSINVQIMLEHDDGTIGFLPWVDKDTSLLANKVPSNEIARKILNQRVSLPYELCSEFQFDKTIKAIEQEMEGKVPTWQNNPWLRGEYILFLDNNCEKTINSFHVKYGKDSGLITYRM